MSIAPVYAGQRVTSGMLNSLPVTVAPLVLGSVTNSVAETVIGTFNIPSSYLDAVNAAVAFTVIGQAASNSAAAAIRIRARLGGVAGSVLADQGGMTTPGATFTARFWGLQLALYTVTEGTTGAIASYGTFAQAWGASPITGAAPVSIGLGTTNAGPVDTTQPLVVVITALCSAASTGIGAQALAGSVEPQG